MIGFKYEISGTLIGLVVHLLKLFQGTERKFRNQRRGSGLAEGGQERQGRSEPRGAEPQKAPGTGLWMGGIDGKKPKGSSWGLRAFFLAKKGGGGKYAVFLQTKGGGEIC